MCYIFRVMRDRHYKNLTRIYINSQDLKPEDTHNLTENQIHYLRNVLRLNIGDMIRIFNGNDGEWLAKIISLSKKNCKIELAKQIKKQCYSPDIEIIFSPVKKRRQDFLIEKVTELGVSKITLVKTKYCQIKKVNIDKIKLQIIEAAEQSERLDIAEINEVKNLDTLLTAWQRDRKLFVCAEKNFAIPIADALKTVTKNDKISILVGPEGGFSDIEIEKLASAKFTTMIDLGKNILRTETAAIVAISCFKIL